jgi:hypothetical protein
MATGATGQLGLALPVQGELSGTWGDTVNNGITQYTNIAIAGTLTLTNDGAVTLANTTGDASASNITSTLAGAGTVTAQFAIVRVTGTLTVAKVVTAPSYSKTYTVVNAATGGIVTFKAAGQTGVSVAVGETAFVYFNGTDYVKVVGTATAGAAGGSTTQVQFNSSGVLAGSANLTFDGTNLTLGGGTANGVTYLNGSKVLTSGSAIVFDGTNLGVGASSPAYKLDVTSTADASLLQIKSTAAANNTAMRFGIDGNNSFINASGGSTGALQLRTFGTTQATLDVSGNFGIGATSLSDKLTVGDGTISTDAVVRINGGSNTGKGSGIRLMKAGTAYAYIGSTSWLLGTGTSNNLSLSTTGLSDLTLDTSGNLGLGVTPSTWTLFKSLEIAKVGSSFVARSDVNQIDISCNWYYNGGGRYASNDYATQYEQTSGKHVWYTAPSGTAGNAITFTQAMTLDASGNLSVGTTSPSFTAGSRGNITVGGSTSAIYALQVGGTAKAYTFHDGTDMTLANDANGYLRFNTNATERARIDSSGTFLVGATSIAGNVVQIYNNSNQAGRININKTTSGLFNALVFTYSGTTVGSIDYSNTGTAFNTSSDIRLKKDIVDAGSASAKIDQIRIVSHGWKHDDAVVEFGVIAQELVNIAPQAVAVGDDGEEIETTWGVDYSKLIPLLIKAHQEQQAIIESLKARLDAANL